MSKCIHNKRKSRCKECGGSQICINEKQKYQCKECGGSQICIHNIQKAKCKECVGSQICIHNKYKSRCIECGGNELCIHNILNNMCKKCKGSSICEHNKHKPHCKECNGISICKHNKRKSMCKECGGSQICIHNIDKSRCYECGGSGLCIHKKRKEYCKECDGSQICIHNKCKSNCKECNGSCFCVHNKQKIRCKDCDGSDLCKSTFCEKRKIKKYNNYCLSCCVNLFPEIKVSRNHKTKEKTVVDYIINKFSNYTWLCDKQIYDGCSKRRPDLLLDLGDQIIIVEIDENKHNNYDCICENKRLMEISQDLNHRPIIFIRFNPDKYNNEGNIIKSCWKLNNKTGILYIDKNKKNEWNERLKTIELQIIYWINNKTDKTIEIIELFY